MAKPNAEQQAAQRDIFKDIKTRYKHFVVAAWSDDNERHPSVVHIHTDPKFIDASTYEFRVRQRYQKVKVFAANGLLFDMQLLSWREPDSGDRYDR
jgi:hypothetical protein